MERHFIPIWFFIGLLLGIYGILILGAGLYGLGHPPAQHVVLANLHIGIWWGLVLIALGGFYVYHFFPGKR